MAPHGRLARRAAPRVRVHDPWWPRIRVPLPRRPHPSQRARITVARSPANQASALVHCQRWPGPLPQPKRHRVCAAVAEPAVTLRVPFQPLAPLLQLELPGPRPPPPLAAQRADGERLLPQRQALKHGLQRVVGEGLLLLLALRGRGALLLMSAHCRGHRCCLRGLRAICACDMELFLSLSRLPGPSVKPVAE